MKTLIPIRTHFDYVNEPGHIEQNCVIHCGESVAGEYTETLNSLDIETCWNEQTTFFKKTDRKVVSAFDQQRKLFPLPIFSTDFDNGFEFVNWNMHRYCMNHNIKFTRSRPYRKNDQAHIEDKNYNTIRKVISYDRIESEETVDLINSIYHNEFRLLNNFFCTTRKLEVKYRADGKLHKSYGKAMTPYARVISSKTIKLSVKIKLIQQYK